ncbi:MAG: hypothetical protein M3Q45_00445, partial [Chloroflexota bacterium]|nr:hypothetical protein [Chloroflexota bacterium]
YNGWSAVLNGYAKNILAGHGNSILFLLLSTLFHLAIFVVPWLWLMVCLFGVKSVGWPLLLCGLGIGIRAVTAFATHQRLPDALLLPVSVLLMTRIALQAIGWQWRYGGPQWKGRVVKGQ